MNKILVANNKIKTFNGIQTNDNHIIFNKSGEYKIEYIDCNDLTIEYEVLEGIDVTILEYSEALTMNSKIKLNLNRNSNTTIYKFYTSNNIKEDIKINLNGEFSKIDYHFSNICTGKENYHFIINHNASNTISNVLNKLISLDKSTLKCTIDSNLPDGNKKCVLNQDTKIITFGDSDSTIQPNMFIEENDVEARHGSVIGKFNEEDIFYLLSRGIEYNSAIKLLVKGYILSNLNFDMENRMKVLDKINKYWR